MAAAQSVWDGGQAFDDLLARVDDLRRMANARYESFVVDDLCGLSLQGLRDKRLAEQTQREAEKLKRIEDAAAGRRNCLAREARDGLGDPAADEWLGQPSPISGISLMQWAGESDTQLGQAERLLGEAIRDARARRAAAEAVLLLQRELETKARAAILDPQRAELFIKAWRGECDSRAALTGILAKLPKRR